MSNSLKSTTINAFFWSFIERVGQQGVQFIISIILARLLLPEQFGLIGMLVLFLGLAQSFLDSGFGSALIQKKEATHTDYCSIFFFNIAVGFFAAGLLCLIAPLIAGFYKLPQLTSLTRFLSLNIVINSFALIQTTLLSKNVDFKALSKISIITAAASGTIGVVMAINGFGVWSLAIQQVCGNLFRTVLLWFYSAWRPSLVFSFTSLRDMFSFGSRLLASGLLNTIFENSYMVVIGKLFSAASLGYYSRAWSLQQLPSMNLTEIVTRVTFPLFSSIQDDPNQLKRGFKKTLSTIGLFNFPVMIGLLVVSKSLVSVLLTDKWLPCVPYLQLLCVVGLMYPLHAINLNLLNALGRSDLFFRLEVIKKIMVVGNISITWRFGIETMIYGQIIISILAYYLNSYYTAKLIDYTLKEQLLDLSPALGVAISMGACIYNVQLIPNVSQLLILVLQVTLGVVIYCLLALLFRLSAFIELTDSARYRIKMRKVNI